MGAASLQGCSKWSGSAGLALTGSAQPVEILKQLRYPNRAVSACGSLIDII